MKRVLIFLMGAFLVMSAGLGWATSFEQKNFDQLVAESDEIFAGTVSTAAPRKLAAGGIVTDVVFTNLQVLKGNTANTSISLMTMGGTIGTETFEIRGLPKFQINADHEPICAASPIVANFITRALGGFSPGCSQQVALR